MKYPPTDRQILKKIHNMYYSDFCCFDPADPSRTSKIYVPIDCAIIAKHFKVDADIIFGRLYYHLQKKHGYKQDDGSLVSLFSLRSGKNPHVVHFPLLSGLVAEQNISWFRFNAPFIISVIALVTAILTK